MRNTITKANGVSTLMLESLEAGTVFQFLNTDNSDNYYIVVFSASKKDTIPIVHLNTGNLFEKQKWASVVKLAGAIVLSPPV